MGLPKIALEIAERVAPAAFERGSAIVAEVGEAMADAALPDSVRAIAKKAVSGIIRPSSAASETLAKDLPRVEFTGLAEQPHFGAPHSDQRAVFNPSGVSSDLARLFGTDRLAAAMRGQELMFEHPVPTRAGNVNLRVSYSSKYSTAYFYTPDTWTTGTMANMRMQPGTTNPLTRMVYKDTDGILHGLFKRGGFDNLANETPNFGEKLFDDRLQAIVGVRANRELLQKALRDPKGTDLIREEWRGGPTQLVRQAESGIAPLSTALETNGLATCAALCISNQRMGVHYLAHIDALVAEDTITKSISRFDLGASTVHLLPGSLMHPSALETAFAALNRFPNGTKNLRFLSTRSTDFAGVVMHDGKLFQPVSSIRKY